MIPEGFVMTVYISENKFHEFSGMFIKVKEKLKNTVIMDEIFKFCVIERRYNFVEFLLQHKVNVIVEYFWGMDEN